MRECVLLKREDTEKILSQVTGPGKQMIFKSADIPVGILRDKEVANNDAEVHMDQGDIWIGLRGEATFTYGGELVDPWFGKNSDGTENKRELRAKSIKNGEVAVVRAGDVFWIPPGQPHQHNGKLADLLIIKHNDAANK